MREEATSLRRWVPLTLALVVASLGCLVMISLRVALTGSIRYSFLLWNLALAWIPYLLALALQKASSSGRPGAPPTLPTAALALAWLFFYPNAPYILTDFIHVIRLPLRVRSHPLITENALLWYDIILNSSFAFIGHIIGLISLLILHLTIRRSFGARWGWGFAVIATGLGGYGIYLGRFERLNSWDIVRDPIRTMRIGLTNLLNLKAVLVSLCFAFFIFLTYVAVHYLYLTPGRGAGDVSAEA
jgi:uncharacterized membrane protein